MKYKFLILLCLFFTANALAQNIDKLELNEYVIHPVFSTQQFIKYTVPIALNTSTDMYGTLKGENIQINADELQKLENERLNENERLKFVKTVFEKVRSG